MRFPFLLAAAALALAACAQPQTPPANPRLDGLFAALKAAPNETVARQIETQIWSVWNQSGSATVDVLMARAETSLAGGDKDATRAFLLKATALAPNYAEAWDRLAVLAFDSQDYGGALNAIRETLAREPRHFGALAGLGMIYESLGDDEAALRAFRDALAIDPYLEEAKQGEKRLAPKVDGREA